MQPSYTSMKLIHEQHIRESMEQQPFDPEPEKSGRSLLQRFGTFLARMNARSAGNKKEFLSGSVKASAEQC